MRKKLKPKFVSEEPIEVPVVDKLVAKLDESNDEITELKPTTQVIIEG